MVHISLENVCTLHQSSINFFSKLSKPSHSLMEFTEQNLHIQLIFLLLLTTISISSPTPLYNNSQLNSLSDFKSSLLDPKKTLTNWQLSNPITNWSGLTYEAQTGNVISIDFTNFGLSGTTLDSLCKLPYLTSLVLDNNNFTGNIPTCFTRLDTLRLGSNKLIGTLPCFASLGEFLKVLDLHGNNIVGGVPSCMSRLVKLTELNLSRNGLQYGISPVLEFSRELVVLDLSRNKLSGEIPRGIVGIRGLLLLDLSWNMFEGEIPVEITELKSLQGLFLGGNRLSGEIPARIGNLANVQVIELSRNMLSGEIPLNIVGCFKLLELKVNDNNLSGMIQPEFNAFDSLKVLDISHNRFSGEILMMLAGCKSLEVVDLSFNNLIGELNESIRKWSNLRYLSLARNNFKGIIPSWLFAFKQIQYIDISGNGFSGFIPQESFNSSVSFRNSSSYDSIFSGVQNEDDIVVFVDVIENKDLSFNYKLGSRIGIDLSDNSLHGEIPEGLFRLQGLEYLNLSHNYLIGQVPESLETMQRLKTLDLSFNSLTGKISANLSSFSGSFSGNPELCVEYSGEGCRFLVAPQGIFEGEGKGEAEGLVSCWAFWISALVSFYASVVGLFCFSPARNYILHTTKSVL